MTAPLGPFAKARIALMTWTVLARVFVMVKARPLPVVVERLSRPGDTSIDIDPIVLGRYVHKALSTPLGVPRCLYLALVHFRLLIRTGHRPELIIGLPDRADSPEAHAWIEIDSIDVGPPPGRSDSVEMARYR